MTLTEFLLARIADQEAAARVDRAVDADPLVTRYATQALAECEAKRRIVEDLTAHLEADHAAMESPVASASWHAKATALKSVAYLLALSYADHPDYDEAWRP